MDLSHALFYLSKKENIIDTRILIESHEKLMLNCCIRIRTRVLWKSGGVSAYVSGNKQEIHLASGTFSVAAI